jgi:CTP synthase
VKELREIGLQPDFLVCRSEKKIDDELKNKIALFCSVKKEHVVSAQDSSSIYNVPMALHHEKLDDLIVKVLNLKSKKFDLSGWKKVMSILEKPKKSVKISVVGKYVDLKEAYKSLNESLVHAGIANQAAVEIQYVDSEKISVKNVANLIGNSHGVLVPGGFGHRGVEGKILAIQYARENKVPFFGICFGMQLSAIEFARNVCGLKNATSREFYEKTAAGKVEKNFIIDIMDEQKNITDKGGTMRLGLYSCEISEKSKVYKIYGTNKINERHRHRYEFNNEYKSALEKKGLVFSGINKKKNLVEILENKNHPWFIAVQFHPEFKSKPLTPHPLFKSFIKASLQHDK